MSKMTGFRRSLSIRHLVCGSCNGCEHEMNALAGPDYDITQQGFDIVASPRHADVITVTGPMSEAMLEPAAETLEATPRPRLVVAIGDCAAGTGALCNIGSAGPGAGIALRAGVTVSGCPPAPDEIKRGLARAAALLDEIASSG